MTYALLILMTINALANSPLCEVYNIDEDRCEFFADQNLTINLEFTTLINGVYDKKEKRYKLVK